MKHFLFGLLIVSVLSIPSFANTIFFDDFEDNNYDGWDLYMTSSGASGPCIPPEITNGWLEYTIASQHANFLVKEIDETLESCTYELDFRILNTVGGNRLTKITFCTTGDIGSLDWYETLIDGYCLGLNVRDSNYYVAYTGLHSSPYLATGSFTPSYNVIYHVKFELINNQLINIYLNELGQNEILLTTIDMASSGYAPFEGRGISLGGGEVNVEFDNISIATEDNYLYPSSVVINGMINAELDDLFVDENNIAGLSVDATDVYDSGLDVPEPNPPSTDYLSIVFPRVEWGLPVDNFMHDIRNGNDDLTNDVKVFNFDVASDQLGETVDLEFNISDDYPADYGVVLYAYDSGEYKNLREDNSYSFDLLNTSYNFDLRLGDATAPVITQLTPEDQDTLFWDEFVPISWSSVDVTAIRYNRLYYTLDNGFSWTQIDSISGDLHGYDWMPPDVFCINARLRIDSEDWAGNFTSYEATETFFIIPTELENQFYAGLQMISLPLNPEDEDITAVFGDDVSTAYFLYNYMQNSGYELVGDVQCGNGYWLYLEEDALIDVQGVANLGEVNKDLNSNWTIVGCAFPGYHAIEDLEFTDGTTTYSYTEAVDNGWILAGVYSYNMSTNGYELVNDLAAWQGAWVYTVIDNLTMISSAENVNASPSGADIDEINNSDDILDWFVPVSISQGNLSDNLGGIGANEHASDGYDSWYDLASPPGSPGDFLRGYFNHEEWGAPVEQFARDIRQATEDSDYFEWTFSVQTSTPGEVTISFNEITERLPEVYGAMINIEGSDYDLRENNTVSFNCPGESELIVLVYYLEDVVDGNDYTAITDFAISSVYPNPFNSSTNINFAVPEQGHLKVQMYNTLGQEVMLLHDGEVQSGITTAVFNAVNLPSGVYFIRGSFKHQETVLQKITYLR